MNQNLSYRFPFASYPALRLVLLVITGICIARFSNGYSVGLYIIIFSGFFLAWAVAELIPLPRLYSWKPAITAVLYSLMVICFGAVLGSAEQERAKILQQETAPLQLYEWETVTISGRIYSRGKSSSGRNVYEITVDKTHLPDGITWTKAYNIRVYGDEGEPVIPKSHQRINADIELYAFPEKRNPHEFDYSKWLKSQSISAHGELVNLKYSSPAARSGWVQIRQGFLSRIDRFFSEDEASLAKALFIGYKKELTDETRKAFSRAGLSHIMAVSGMHVGFIVAPFWLLIPWFWRWSWGRLFGLALLTLLLMGYAGITGFSASVSRASIMAWLLAYGKLFQKQRHSVNLVAVAALLLLLNRPSDISDVGFQLSFSAVIIILLIMPRAQNLIPLRYRYNRTGGLITIVLISVIVQIGLFPILAAYFGEFSVMGPVANALVVPLLGVVVPAGLLISAIGDWIGNVAMKASIPIEWALRWIGEVAANAGGTSWSYISVADVSHWLFPVWGMAILTLAAIQIPRLRWKLCILTLLSVNILLIDLMIKKGDSIRLELTALDVGQGDAIHIRTPSGKHILVDAGRWSPGGNSGERTIIPYLKHRGVDEIDAVILSHPHADHIGGMPDLIRKVPVKTIYQSSRAYDSRLYERYMFLADSMDVPIQSVNAGDMIDIDPAIRLFILGPEENASGNINNASVSFRLDYAKTTFLFTGDAEKSQERSLVDRYGDFLNADLLKTGHHGSKTSSGSFFLDYVTPDITMTSVAFNNRFGHPHPEAVLSLNKSGAKNYFTSLSGALIFSSDGKDIVRKRE